MDRGCNGFIRKLFGMKELSQKLRENEGWRDQCMPLLSCPTTIALCCRPGAQTLINSQIKM